MCVKPDEPVVMDERLLMVEEVKGGGEVGQGEMDTDG